MRQSPRTLLGILLAAGGLAGALRAQCPDGTPPPCRRAARPVAAPSANSVAVLYFDNLSRDTSDAYLADGLTEEITARLGQVGRLVVTSRTAVRRLANAATMSTPEIGRALGVSYLLNGSVRRSPSRLRVTVELVRASSGVQVWSSQFDQSQADLLAIQEEIAVAVAAGIVGQLLPDERATLARRPTRNAAAYDAYLRGSRMVWDVDPRSTALAIEAFETALRLDPGFTAARGRIAYAFGWALNWNQPLPGVPVESLPARGEAAALRALAEDSTSADAWSGLGFVRFLRDPPDYPGALAAMRRAVALDSSNVFVRQNNAVLLRRMGAFDAAGAEYHRALELQPGLSQMVGDLGFIAYSRRRYREAEGWYDSALTLNQGAWQHLTYRARIRLELHDTAGARQDADDAVRLVAVASRSLALAVLAQVEARTGDAASGRARLEPVLASVAEGPISVREGYELDLALVATGQKDRALDLLERVRPRGAWLWSYLVFPGFDPIRAEPRFVRIFEEARPPGAPRLP